MTKYKLKFVLNNSKHPTHYKNKCINKSSSEVLNYDPINFKTHNYDI